MSAAINPGYCNRLPTQLCRSPYLRERPGLHQSTSRLTGSPASGLDPVLVDFFGFLTEQLGCDQHIQKIVQTN